MKRAGVKVVVNSELEGGAILRVVDFGGVFETPVFVLVEVFEENVGGVGGGEDFGDIGMVTEGEELCIDASAADDENF